MDQSTIISTIIGALAALIGSFGATFFAQWLSQKQENNKRYKEKIEEIQELYIIVKQWIDFEFEDLWMEYEHNKTRDKNNLDCPIGKIIMLVEIYEPSLYENMSKIKETIEFLKNIDFDMHESRIDDEKYYYKIYVSDNNKKFREVDNKIYQSFKVINMGNKKKKRNLSL